MFITIVLVVSWSDSILGDNEVDLVNQSKSCGINNNLHVGFIQLNVFCLEFIYFVH